jgi:polyisoprenoid-binding protein YceI
MLGLTAAVFVAFSRANAADNYKIDPAHTSVGFSVRHMGVSNVKGHFDDFRGSLVLDNGTLQEASGTIQVKSVNTGIEKRDNHLRSPVSSTRPNSLRLRSRPSRSKRAATRRS